MLHRTHFRLEMAPRGPRLASLFAAMSCHRESVSYYCFFATLAVPELCFFQVPEISFSLSAGFWRTTPRSTPTTGPPVHCADTMSHLGKSKASRHPNMIHIFECPNSCSRSSCVASRWCTLHRNLSLLSSKPVSRDKRIYRNSLVKPNVNFDWQ